MNAPTLSLITAPPPGDAVRRSFFAAEMPVSYDTTGNVASRFGDIAWNMSSMSNDGTSVKTLHFFKAYSSTASNVCWLIREQHKALMWLHMDAGKTRSWATLLNTALALNICCKEAVAKGVDLFSLLTKLEWVTQVARGMNRVYLAMLSSVLRTLWRHRQQLEAPTDFPYQALLAGLATEANSRPGDQQTPLIPSRVYCAILAALGDRMGVIERELDDLLTAYEASQVIRKTGSKNWNARTKALADATERMREIGYEPTKAKSLAQFIAARLIEHKVTLMLVVAAFTGMRVGEVSILPVDDVLGEFEFLGSKHYEVKGWSHKLHNGVKHPSAWVTSHQGVRAVRLAQRIAKTIHQHHGAPPKAGQQVLLFPSSRNAFKALSDDSFQRALNRLREDICPVIAPSDIEELDQLDLARSWMRDDLKVGKRWPLAFHQLRRSLAVYAHRSGMVSLPALKAQLQHITEEMTSYYADGFSNAVNLVFDKDHFSHEWKSAKAESSYFAYAFGVLFSDEDLLGQGAQRMANTVESRDQLDTLRLFEENKLAYRETPLGGCVSTEDCKTDPLEPIPYDCLETNCVNLVVFGKRLEHVIKHQEVAVATLASDESGSVEHRLEANHLKVLLKARERLQKGVR